MRSWFFSFFLFFPLFTFRTVCSAVYSHRWQYMHWGWKMAINMLWSMWFSISFKHMGFPSPLLCTLGHFISVLSISQRFSWSTFFSWIWGSIRYSLFASFGWYYMLENTGESSQMRTFLSSVTTIIKTDVKAYQNKHWNIKPDGGIFVHLFWARSQLTDTSINALISVRLVWFAPSKDQAQQTVR